MVRSAKWMSSIVVALVLGWQLPASVAQQPLFTGEPTPARLRTAQREKYEPAPEETDDTDSPEECEDSDGTAPATPEPKDDDGDETDSPKSGSKSSSAEVETIKERYPNGKVKVEREVAQDDEGNYHNHGMWKTWDDRGNLVAQGEYDHGSRTGIWIRWYRDVKETPVLGQRPYSSFTGPFISQASFDAGQLDGAWTVFDSKKNKICQFEFSHGKRHGMSTWWHTNGHKLREIEFRDGEIHGQVIEWNPEGTLLVKESYKDGRKLAPRVVSKHPDGSKKAEGVFLSAREVEQTPDDWWTFRLRTVAKQGKEERHGLWTTWYSNGQPQLEGNYANDLQDGQFTWWHANGQKALEGHFAAGKQTGAWTWWYPTGQKSIRGEYSTGAPTGRWTWWKENGKVNQSADLSQSEGVVIETPNMNDLDAVPQAAKPRPRMQQSR